MFVSIQELEAAINYWRARSPSSGDAVVLCAEAAALAKPYALMILQGSQRSPIELLEPAALAALKEFVARST